jgi:hypothetical protein
MDTTSGYTAGHVNGTLRPRADLVSRRVAARWMPFEAHADDDAGDERHGGCRIGFGTRYVALAPNTADTHTGFMGRATRTSSALPPSEPRLPRRRTTLKPCVTSSRATSRFRSPRRRPTRARAPTTRRPASHRGRDRQGDRGESRGEGCEGRVVGVVATAVLFALFGLIVKATKPAVGAPPSVSRTTPTAQPSATTVKTSDAARVTTTPPPASTIPTATASVAVATAKPMATSKPTPSATQVQPTAVPTVTKPLPTNDTHVPTDNL